LAAQVRGLRDCGADRRARAGSVRGFLGAENRVPVDEPQASKQQQKKRFFPDDYQRVKHLLRRLGSVFELPQYFRNLTSAANFTE
jgi:hypothetical protein